MVFKADLPFNSQLLTLCTQTMRAKEILHALLGSMEEHTLQLAQKLARQATLEENNDSDSSEARDGNPMPLKSMAAKLEEKVKGFR